MTTHFERLLEMNREYDRVPTRGGSRLVACVILFCLISSSWATSSVEDVISRLTLRTDATYRYHKDAVIGYETRRDQLLNSKTVGISPTLFTTPRALSDGQLLYGTTATYNSARLNSSVSFMAGENPVQSASAQVLLTLLSDTKKRTAQIDTVISLIEKKATLTREAMIFADFKQVLHYRMSVQNLADEAQVRRETTIRAEEFLARLQKIIATGSIPRNAVQSLQLFIKNNALRLRAIELEQELISSTTAYQLGIDSTLFKALEIDQCMKQADLASGAAISDYSWKIDSLNNLIQHFSAKEQNGDSWKLSAGGGVSFVDPSEPSLYTTSAIAQVQYTFNKRALPTLTPLKKSENIAFPENSQELLESYKAAAKAQAQEATAWIRTTLERIALGETSSIYEISDNLSAIQSHQLAYFALKNSYLQRDLLRLRYMAQLPEISGGGR